MISISTNYRSRGAEKVKPARESEGATPKARADGALQSEKMESERTSLASSFNYWSVHYGLFNFLDLYTAPHFAVLVVCSSGNYIFISPY